MAFLDSIKNLLIETVPDLVIKYSNIAAMYETVDTKRAGDRYVAAKRKLDTFDSYPSYSTQCLLAAGFIESDAIAFSKDRSKIPSSKRAIVLEMQRKMIINDYVEENDYYRTLNGLPMLEDMEEIWLPMEVYEEYDITPGPVHEINPETLLVFEALGILDNIIAEHPERKYLQHLGKKRIDICTARLADNFEIIYMPRLDHGEIFYRDFMMVYEECREYFLTVIYNTYYGTKYDYYDNYLAFDILIMTMNKMVSSMMLKYIQRDFYDVDTLRIFLEAYGIEYNSVFTFAQLKLVAKNLNLLLQSKSTDRVFIDMLELLGYSNFSVMKYYLVKQHIFDENNKPVFYYKTVTDEDGNTSEVLDVERMYKYYFVRTEIGTYNIQEILSDTANVLPYNQVAGLDDYWIEDAQLKEKLASSEFNYIDTKYIDINVVYNMHSVMFETIYLTRMVLDKTETKAIYVNLPTISEEEVALFDVFILLICLLCKYNHIEPDILKSPSKIMYILGYNFEADFEAIKQEILNRRDLDDSLVNYIKTTTFTTASDVNALFGNVKELEQLLVKLMNETESKATYNAYEKIYRTLMWTKLNDSIYKVNGHVPDQFTDYLFQASGRLYSYYISCETDEQIIQAIDYVTTKMMNLFSNVKYLKLIKIMDETQLTAIRKLLCFFKSYTVNMQETKMVLILDNRYFNMVHFSTYLDFSGEGPTNLVIPDSTMLEMIIDALHKENGYISPYDKFDVNEYQMFLGNIIPKLKVYIDFKMFLHFDEKMINHVFVADGPNDIFCDMNTEDESHLNNLALMVAEGIYKYHIDMSKHNAEYLPEEKIYKDLTIKGKQKFSWTLNHSIFLKWKERFVTIQKWWHSEYFVTKITQELHAEFNLPDDILVGSYYYRNSITERLPNEYQTMIDRLTDLKYNGFANKYYINFRETSNADKVLSIKGNCLSSHVLGFHKDKYLTDQKYDLTDMCVSIERTLRPDLKIYFPSELNYSSQTSMGDFVNAHTRHILNPNIEVNDNEGLTMADSYKFIWET